MNAWRLLHRSALYHRRSHLAVALGVLAATATLTGALVVGDSMRLSLQLTALQRLGNIDQALISGRLFSQNLADKLQDDSDISQICSTFIASGRIEHADSSARVNGVTIYGIAPPFWDIVAPESSRRQPELSGRNAFINERLAEQIGAKVGDDVVLRIGKPSLISPEMLLGRRDDMTASARLTVAGLVPAVEGGQFALAPSQRPPDNVFMPLNVLQNILDKKGKANCILIESASRRELPESAKATDAATALGRSLDGQIELNDVGLTLRVDHDRKYVALESEHLLIDPVVEQAAIRAASSLDLEAAPVLTYLANDITIANLAAGDSQARSIPYSTVSAVHSAESGEGLLTLVDGNSAPMLRDGEILLSEWAAKDLGIADDDLGDGITVTLSYFITDKMGSLETKTESFLLRGVVRMDSAVADPGFVPPYPGITDAQHLGDWDPPFPIDLKKIREQDEKYWDEYRTAPKAFLSLAHARRLWTSDSEHLGQSTSIRFHAEQGGSLDELASSIDRAIRTELDIKDLGLQFEPVKQRALQASQGTTDFGVLFVSFSFFIIVSAAMLVALLFRLGVEQRASEIGLLLSIGIPPSKVNRFLLVEGLLIACVGSAAGVVASAGYAWLMLSGLKTWWSDAVNAPFLQLHVEPVTILIGLLSGGLIAMFSIALSIRRLCLLPARLLLSGQANLTNLQPIRQPQRSSLLGSVILSILAAVMLVIPSTTELLPQTAGFFIGSALMMIACLLLLRAWLRMSHRSVLAQPGASAIVRLGVRNAPRNPGRSMLAAGLIASASFIIASIGVMRLDPDVSTTRVQSSTGGYSMLAESAVPLAGDLSTVEGRESLGMTDASAAAFANLSVNAFRLRPGDHGSCRGLYCPKKPRIIGASNEFIDRNSFQFASSVASSGPELDNPWLLLNSKFDDGAIPVIGEKSSVMWQYHLGLGKDLVITDGRGQSVRLRFVALLDRSVLQDELIISSDHFQKLFPRVFGHSFFLLECPPDSMIELHQLLEKQLSHVGFDVKTTSKRLIDYSLVQNTYLKTFHTLGGLGLILGTLGMAVILARNVVERRSELALMRAVGFSDRAIALTVLSENGFLILAGLLSGAIPATIAIAPHLINRPDDVPFISTGITLFGVLLIGVVSGALVLRATLRGALVPALRSE